eukprot:COSAG01_NODE_72027_length_254_cov_0.664516_2_plen_27_part_01
MNRSRTVHSEPHYVSGGRGRIGRQRRK